jgi:hypothetical protein
VLLDVDMLMPDSFCTILFSWSCLQDKGSATPQYHRLSLQPHFRGGEHRDYMVVPSQVYLPNESFDEMRNVSVAR